MTYKQIISRFRNRNVLVMGDIILDHYIWGTVDRISPEAPVPVVAVNREEYLLGGAGNVAHNLVSLGARATIAGIIGNDHRGDLLMEIFREKGIDMEGVIRAERPTTVKTRVIAHSQQVVRVDRENPSDIEEPYFRRIAGFIRERLEQYDAVIISDYQKGLVTSRMVRHVNRHARRHGIFVSVDPKVGNFPFYRGVSVVTPNKKEASAGSGIPIRDEKSLIRAGRKLLSTLRCESVLITLGEEGMSLFTREDVHHIPTMARHVYDVTGAGDTVIAAFTLAAVSGASMLQAARIANHAAGIVVAEVGTATTTPDAVLDSLEQHTFKAAKLPK